MCLRSKVVRLFWRSWRHIWQKVTVICLKRSTFLSTSPFKISRIFANQEDKWQRLIRGTVIVIRLCLPFTASHLPLVKVTRKERSITFLISMKYSRYYEWFTVVPCCLRPCHRRGSRHSPPIGGYLFIYPYIFTGAPRGRWPLLALNGFPIGSSLCWKVTSLSRSQATLLID